MKQSSKTKRNLLIGGYGILALSGLLIGMAAQPKQATPADGAENVEDLLKRAIEKIAKDAKDSKAEDQQEITKIKNSNHVAFSPSPEPAVDAGVDAGAPIRAALPTPDANGGKGKKVIVVAVTEEIQMGLPTYIRRAIADNMDAAALILDLNTPGGRIDAAQQIRDTLQKAPKTMKTVAFVNPRAASAGAFISLACDYIFIADGGTIGAATPISIAGGKAEPVEEKFVSYFRTEMAAIARSKGRRGDIAEAMVDSDVTIDGITPAGKLLTLDTTGALRWKIADDRANSLDEVLGKLALSKAQIVTPHLNWAERMAQIFTSPVLSGILMSIGMLGILIELYHPGFGLPGIVGLTCLIIFFAGHLVVHLAGWEEVLLFVLGVILLVIEIYVTPGFGVAGVIGLILIVAGLVLSLSSAPADVSFNTGILTAGLFRVLLSLLIVAVLFVAAMALLPKIRGRNPLVLQTVMDGTSAGGLEGENIKAALTSGKTGIALTSLRPAGIAQFGDKRIDVVTEGVLLDQGENIVIVRAEGNRVIVRKET